MAAGPYSPQAKAWRGLIEDLAAVKVRRRVNVDGTVTASYWTEDQADNDLPRHVFDINLDGTFSERSTITVRV